MSRSGVGDPLLRVDSLRFKVQRPQIGRLGHQFRGAKLLPGWTRRQRWETIMVRDRGLSIAGLLLMFYRLRIA